VTFYTGVIEFCAESEIKSAEFFSQLGLSHFEIAFVRFAFLAFVLFRFFVSCFILYKKVSFSSRHVADERPIQVFSWIYFYF
jgi:hypothetical protein